MSKITWRHLLKTFKVCNCLPAWLDAWLRKTPIELGDGVKDSRFGLGSEIQVKVWKMKWDCEKYKFDYSGSRSYRLHPQINWLLTSSLFNPPQLEIVPSKQIHFRFQSFAIICVKNIHKLRTPRKYPLFSLVRTLFIEALHDLRIYAYTHTHTQEEHFEACVSLSSSCTQMSKKFAKYGYYANFSPVAKDFLP